MTDSDSITEQAARLLAKHRHTTDDGWTCMGDPLSDMSTCDADLRLTTLLRHQAEVLANAGLLAHPAPATEDGSVSDTRVAEVLHLLTNEVEARSREWEAVAVEAAFRRARRIILNAFGLRIPLDVPEHVREGWRLGMLRNTHKVPLWHTCPTEDDEQPAPTAPATEDEAAEVACAWSDYRADYGVSPSAITEAHKAFKAGWAAHRDGDTRGALR